ncbi:hypothetical protein [Oscillatoria nigro-viridis]|nr:hypothetical protein [Oscillatoria nigro-viridis]
MAAATLAAASRKLIAANLSYVQCAVQSQRSTAAALADDFG